MPEFIGGLPIHPLLVHFTVVLIVLAVAGAVLTAVWPAVRRRFGWLVFAAAAVGTLLVPFTTKSGENLAGRLPASPQIAEHERLGDMTLWWAIGLTVAVGSLMVVHTMAERKVTTRVAVGAAGAEEEVPAEAGRYRAAGGKRRLRQWHCPSTSSLRQAKQHISEPSRLPPPSNRIPYIEH